MTIRSNTASGAVTRYEFDHRNRLVLVTDVESGGITNQIVAFVYDAMNRRLSKTVDGQTTRFLYSQDDGWADLDQSNTVVARYLLGSKVDELLARWRSSDGSAWYLKDNLGTVREIADGQGAKVAHIDYTVFGQVSSISKAVATDRFLFTGREFDEETDMYFYRARYYSPFFGHFIQEDPIRFDGGDLNLYRYCCNSSLNVMDPTGHATLAEKGTIAATIVISALWGIATYEFCKVANSYSYSSSGDPEAYAGLPPRFLPSHRVGADRTSPAAYEHKKVVFWQ